MPTYKDVKCAQCSVVFSILLKEFNRHVKMGWKNKFCGKTCEHKYKKTHPKETTSHLTLWTADEARAIQPLAVQARWKDQPLNNFTEILRRARNRKHRKDIDNSLTEELLSVIWERQNGTCPYTGWKLQLPRATKTKTPTTASLDRIDSSKGYTEDNIQFVSVMANLAKCDFDNKDMLAFCLAIKQNDSFS